MCLDTIPYVSYAPGYGKEVVDGLNEIDKQYIHQLMSNVQLLASKTFD